MLKAVFTVPEILKVKKPTVLTKEEYYHNKICISNQNGVLPLPSLYTGAAIR